MSQSNLNYIPKPSVFFTVNTSGPQPTQVIDPKIIQGVSLTVSPSGPASITLTASSAPRGCITNLVITATTPQTTTITFGSGFSSRGTFVVAPAQDTRYFLMQFLGDGTNMVEAFRNDAFY